MKLETEKVYTLVFDQKEAGLLESILGGRKPDPYDSWTNQFCQKLYEMLCDARKTGDQK